MNCIYALVDPRTDDTRYIGKTRRPESRLRAHCSNKHHVHSSRWVQSLLREGVKPKMVILEGGLSEEEWPEREQYWIAYYRSHGVNLTNITDGGRHMVTERNDNFLSEPFYMTTQQASIELAKLKLTAMEYRILHYLQGIADYDNIAQTSQVFLAQQLETTEATISVSLKRLDELGVVKKIPYHGRTAFEISQKISTRGKVK
jgi:hypothetical protein